MEFTQLKAENRRQMLENEIGNIEAQLWGRRRDIAHWEAVKAADLSLATGFDSRIANNRDEEVKQQLSAAAYDVIKLEIRLDLTKKELAGLGPNA